MKRISNIFTLTVKQTSEITNLYLKFAPFFISHFGISVVSIPGFVLGSPVTGMIQELRIFNMNRIEKIILTFKLQK